MRLQHRVRPFHHHEPRLRRKTGIAGKSQSPVPRLRHDGAGQEDHHQGKEGRERMREKLMGVTNDSLII